MIVPDFLGGACGRCNPFLGLLTDRGQNKRALKCLCDVVKIKAGCEQAADSNYHSELRKGGENSQLSERTEIPFIFNNGGTIFSIKATQRYS